MKESLLKMRKFQITLLGIIIGTLAFLLVLYMMNVNDRYNDQMISLLGSYFMFIGGIITGFLGAKIGEKFIK